MKILFSSCNRREATRVRKKLFQAGIECKIRRTPIAQDEFGVPACPELWVNKEGDIIRALRLLGPRRLSQMTVVFPG